MSNRKEDVNVILEKTHHAVLSHIHNTLQTEARRYSTVLPHRPYGDYFHEATPIMNLDKNQYLDNITYYSRMMIETDENTYPYIGIFLTTEAYFPLLYARDMAWNLRGNYEFLWDNMQDIMDKMTYSTTWTITYRSSSLCFCCEDMDQPYDFLREEEDNEDKNALEEAQFAIKQVLKPFHS